MNYTQCKQPPSPNQRAIRNPAQGMHGYQSQASEHHRFWSDTEARALPNGIEHVVASTMHRELFVAEAMCNPLVALGNRSALERHRRRGLGSLAVSMIVRNLFYPNAEEETRHEMVDAKEAGYATTVVDMMRGPDGMPLDHRLHLNKDVAEELLGVTPRPHRDTWYREGDLYVRCSQPEISQPMRGILRDGQIELDEPSMVTLTPFLASATHRLAAQN